MLVIQQNKKLFPMDWRTHIFEQGAHGTNNVGNALNCVIVSKMHVWSQVYIGIHDSKKYVHELVFIIIQ